MTTILSRRSSLLLAAAVGCAPTAPATIEFDRQPLATGVTLHYAARGAEDGLAVILLHGYSDSWYSWNTIMPRLSPSYRVYALDQRGHGESDRPATGYHMSDLAADVVAFMDAKGIDRAVVVGHSMGTFVAQQVAQRAPRRVTGVVLIGGASTLQRMAGVEEFGGYVSGFGDTVPVGFTREFQVSTIHHPVPDTLLERVIAESDKLPAHVWRELMQGMLATPAVSALRDTTLPVLILRGDHDQVFPDPGTQDELQALFPGAELVVLPETGHAVHWERPAETAAQLERFLGAR